jgi:ORF6N domain
MEYLMSKAAVALAKRADSRILLLRGQKIILDSDLAELYGVEVKHLNQQLKRNRKRFPGDFLFRLSQREFQLLRSQFVTSNNGPRRQALHALRIH